MMPDQKLRKILKMSEESGVKVDFTDLKKVVGGVMSRLREKHTVENDKKDVWNRRFLELSDFISTWSKDPSTKVGAVIVDPNRRIVSTGYNGLPIGVVDDKDRLEDREKKYKMILHAEENAIMFSRRDLSGCSLYVSSLPPCSHCASLIIQSGIKDVYVWDSVVPDRWMESLKMTETMFGEADVSLHRVSRREDVEVSYAN